ncbi:MAG: hypothetical protein JW726_18625 [Anaerolineales bacterium]|nr:hypothetical protein [Anaerolineales bacterium]
MKSPPLRFFLILLALLVPCLVAFEIYSQIRTPVIDFGIDPQSGRVLDIPSDSFGNYAGFWPGDVIQSIDGIPFASIDLSRLSVATHYASVQRDGLTQTLELVVIPLAQLNRLNLALACLTALAYWGGSLLLLLRRFDHPQASAIHLLFLASQAIAVTLLFPMAYPSPKFHPAWASAITILAVCLAAPLLLHLFLTFPEPLGTPTQQRRWMGLLYLLSLAAAVGWLLGYPAGRLLAIGYILALVCAALGVIVYRYAQRATPDGRRRLRLIVLSTLFAGLPVTLLYILPTLFNSTLRLPLSVAGAFTILAPIGYIIATARHNLFGIDRLLNRALVYTILSLAILLLYLGPFILIYRFLPDDWLAQALVAAGLTLLVGISFEWSRRQAQRLVDHIFFGGWYDYPGVVASISEMLARSLERAQVQQVVTRHIPEMMHLSHASLWIGASDESPPAASTPDLSFPFELQGQRQAVWRVGPHQNGEDFSEADRRILHTLAQQIHIALDNTLLVETLRQQIEQIRRSRDLVTQTQQRLLRSREEERARLARELHDGPIQALVSLNLQLGLLLVPLENVQAAPPFAPSVDGAAEISASLQEMRGEVRGLLTQLRQVCADLRPPMLDALGLGAALRALVAEWSTQNNIEAHLEALPDTELTSLPGEISVNLYRIVQQALSNISRHAQASLVQVTLFHIDAPPPTGALELCIQDNGQGFILPPAHELTAQGHFGLVGIQERAALIGGQISIQSSPGQGARICVTWPFPSPVR